MCSGHVSVANFWNHPLPVDYKSIRAAIGYIKKPIPDVLIKNNKGVLFSRGNFILVLSSENTLVKNASNNLF